tara:strand:- start:1 stop:339 length:339 start_codon:yes stop_codon:yes gene_type:complete
MKFKDIKASINSNQTLMCDINKLYVEIFIRCSFDEERGYLLHTEEMRRRFEKELSKLEDNVSELNVTWQEKQKEYAEDMRTCNGVPVPSVSSVLDYQNWRRVGKTEGENNGE